MHDPIKIKVNLQNRNLWHHKLDFQQIIKVNKAKQR
jgi:hypothetical protein